MFEYSGALLGAFRGPLEGRLGPLGVSWGLLGPRAIMVPPGRLLGRLGPFRGRRGALLGASWGPLG
eukprot:7825924-Pyramimonas_sp.AAC.1